MSAPTSSAFDQTSIAIVDDDASVRVSLKRLCTVFGLHATTYGSGREFLSALEDGAPRADCLLLDAHMPEMTGSELQRHLVAKGIHIPTIVFTADDTPELLAHYTATGVVAFLRKPLSSEDLLAAIERAVRRKE
ncbi:MAG TPA: response regulator [Vicinamibacterales bacterium]|jgi:FixJ family two-component response regulator